MNKKRVLSLLLALCMMVSVISIDTVVKAADDTELTNIALSTNGTLISSNHFTDTGYMATHGYGLDAMIDGVVGKGYGVTDMETTYQYEELYIELVFNATYQVSQIRMRSIGEGFPVDFTLSVCTAKGWEVVAEQKDYPTPAKDTWVEFSFNTKACTKVRLTATENGVNSQGKYFIGMREFEVLGKSVENIALSTNGTLISSNHFTDTTWMATNGYDLDAMIDGKCDASGKYGVTDMGTDYQYETTYVHLQFDSTYRISEIRLESSSVGGFPVDFTLSAWTVDGWQVIDSWENYPVPAAKTWVNIAFDPIVCSAVRLTTTENGTESSGGGKYFIGLYEFEVYGAKEEATISSLPDISEYSEVQTDGTAFCSSAYTYTAANIQLSSLNDGNTSSGYYCSVFFADSVGGQYAGILFENTYCFNSVSIVVPGGDRIPEDFRISVFDGEEWVDVVTETDYPTRSAAFTVEFTFPEMTGTAVKVTADTMREGDTSKHTYALQIRELIINGARTDIQLEQPEVDLYNVSNGMKVSASSVVDWGAPTYGSDLNNLVDVNTKTNYSSIWSANSNNYEWVCVDFDAPVRAHYVEITPWSSNGVKRFPKDFTIEVYTGSEWKTVVEQTDYAKLGYAFCFTPIECTAIRLTATEMDHADSANNYALILQDMKVYGDSANVMLNQPTHTGTKVNRAEAAVVLSKGTNNAVLNDFVPGGKVYTSQLVENAEDATKIQFMFDRSVYIDSMNIFVPSDAAGKFPSDFTVYAFTGEEWEQVFNITGYSSTDKKHFFSFKGVDCSSMMLVAQNMCEIGDRYGMQADEIYLYGAFKDDACTLLGDGNNDAKLSEQSDCAAFRTSIVTESTDTSRFDINMDRDVDVRDLVRMKQYFKEK